MEVAEFDVFIMCFRMMQASASMILNSLTLICVVKYENLRNAAGVLVASLAITDTLHALAIYTLPVRVHVRSVCVISLAIEIFALSAQLMVFVLIAMERRNSLLAQLNGTTKWKVKVVFVMIGIWAVLAICFLVYTTGLPVTPASDICTQSNNFSTSFGYVVSIHGMMCTFTILVIYGTIAKILYSSSRHVASNASQTEQERQRHRAALRITKMMALVFGVFNLCYIPMGISIATIPKSPPFWRHVLHQVLVSLGDVNYWINPAIYAWRNKPFRKAIRQLFAGCLRRCARHNNSVAPANAAPQQVNIETVSATIRLSIPMVTIGSKEQTPSTSSILKTMNGATERSAPMGNDVSTKPKPSTCSTLEPRREFTVGLHDLPTHQAHAMLPPVEI